VISRLLPGKVHHCLVLPGTSRGMAGVPRSNKFMGTPIPVLNVVGGKAWEVVCQVGDIGMVEGHGKSLGGRD